MILTILLSFIFFILGIIHFNWVAGGTFGFEASLPTKESGERILNPKKIDSAIVGFGLIAFAFFYVLKSGLIDYDLPEWILKYVKWIIPSIFMLRAFGDLKYVGFLKKVKHTKFGKLDTKLFSPLCLIIGLIGLIIAAT
ncbi:uncharacterized protein DUF3995 [Aquimarina sp. MAR_2010_214]|uniref:DUF3995 domain-containing protein n=1 Tax=Aquimarina sp. MAR_2010_214 TaxID=1250026 RepID=UPI000C70558E|nr:DUF3995 domain-containing protein [Aquimarina sp. MAR_2010_214]PKV48215.1 uncharacterized protein DUF3995 [Aquimarina sp. MAR_2010_214]